jgi:D-alanyl-D-alanine carboxypeptidase (penicillin-binding protein 5/6)
MSRALLRHPLALAGVALVLVALAVATTGSHSSRAGLLPATTPAAEPPPAAVAGAVSAIAAQDNASAPLAHGLPDVQAAAFAVLDGRTRQLLAGLHADQRRPVASIVKLMTARLVLQAGKPGRLVTIPPLHTAEDESAVGLEPGETQTRGVLLRALLVSSAGDAATALAVDVAGSEERFVARMNAEAAAIGLDHTTYANPVGLDASGATSTARDAVRLAWTLMQDGRVRVVVRRDEVRLHGQTFPATNTLLGSYPGADGVKTGHTNGAGWCIVASAFRDGRRMYVAVLGAESREDRDAAAATLLDWAFAHASAP